MGNRGGFRIGSGRKKDPNSQRQQKLAARVLQHPSVPPTTNQPLQPIEEFDAPDDLAADERAVWLKQAPFAFASRTLTRASALAFERYCKVVVLERNEARSSGMGGANHRGLLKQLQAYEIQFMLAPTGKPMVEPIRPTAQDEDEAFFGGGRA